MAGNNWFRAWAILFGPASFVLLVLIPTPGRTQGAQEEANLVPGSRGLPGFTGYTRPGFPNDIVNREGKIVPVGYEKVVTRVLGGTIYFTVLERVGGVETDSFGTGVKDFNHSFVRGVDEFGDNSPDLDTSARYLYLYQTIDDRTLETTAKTLKDVIPITGTTVRLLVNPSRITSWGHFTGIGFQAHFKAAKKKAEPVKGAAAAKEEGDVILPVSAVNLLVPTKQTVTTRMYLRESPAYRSTQPFTLARITTGQDAKVIKESGITPAVADEMMFRKAIEPTQDPDRVVLLKATNAASRRAIWPFSGARTVEARYAEEERRAEADGEVPGAVDDMDKQASEKEEVVAASTSRQLTRGGVRAVWTAKQPLAPFARGSVFGFTSNLPPVFDGVNLRPLSARRGDAAVPIIPAATDGVVAAAAAAGTVPAVGIAPTPIDRAIVPVAADGLFTAFGWNTLSTLGGQLPGAFSGGFGGGFGTPVAGFVPARGGFGGGGMGGGSGGGNGGRVPSQQQQQQQQQQPANLTQTVAVNVNAAANASASASATASSNASCGGEIIPAPPALLLAAMGLPALWLLSRQRKAMKKPAIS